MTRHDDWPERLAAYVDANRHTPFRWGAFDCATFAAGAVAAMTGDNPLAELPKWKTETGAARVLRRVGGLLAHLQNHFTEIPPAFAGRGDLCLIDGEAVGVVAGDTVLAATAAGLAHVTRSRMTHAFKV